MNTADKPHVILFKTFEDRIEMFTDPPGRRGRFLYLVLGKDGKYAAFEATDSGGSVLVIDADTKEEAIDAVMDFLWDHGGTATIEFELQPEDDWGL